ncbi:MAG: metallophosphoesterase [Deltaproteobacteria bacterium]|nr:metallophosphoesterase [Deltaproteobacteria bacterium]
MRIVAVADTHLFHDDLAVPAGDVFIHAGDLCRAGDAAELLEGQRWLASLPHKTKILVAGNHDWLFATDPKLAREVLGPEVIYLEDSLVTVGGVCFWGSPWQPEYNDWAFNLPRGARLAEKWRMIPDEIDVLITHGPPHGIGDRSSVGGRAGCEALRSRVAEVRPRLHLFGHIHQDGGFWADGVTAFANVTTWECERGATVLELDPASLRVTPVVVPVRTTDPWAGR